MERCDVYGVLLGDFDVFSVKPWPARIRRVPVPEGPLPPPTRGLVFVLFHRNVFVWCLLSGEAGLRQGLGAPFWESGTLALAPPGPGAGPSEASAGVYFCGKRSNCNFTFFSESGLLCRAGRLSEPWPTVCGEPAHKVLLSAS